MDGASGTITYTQWLNSRGTLEADLTVTKLPPPPGLGPGPGLHPGGGAWPFDPVALGGGGGALGVGGFLVVATDTAHRHVESRLRRFAQGLGDGPASGNPSGPATPAEAGRVYACTVTDVTGGLAQLNVQGPMARAVLQVCRWATSPRCVLPLVWPF